jgi:hypothetical protein
MRQVQKAEELLAYGEISGRGRAEFAAHSQVLTAMHIAP